MKGTLAFLLALGCVLGDVEIKPRQLDPRSDEESIEMRDDSIEDSEEMRVDPIDVATLNMGRKGMARNGRQFAPLECGSNDTLHYGEYVVIETPKFGRRKYKNRYSCEWNLVIPANSNLWFSCEYFDVKRGDYLYIADMPLYGTSETGFYMEPVTSPDYDASVTLKFKTNKRRRGWGFRCYVDSEEQSFSPNATTTTTTAAPGVTTTTSSNGNTENCQCGVKNSGNRIVGGVETEANEYPWQVALVSSSGSRPFCGGTLISCSHVLTAAHCTAGSSASGISVLLGEHRIDDSSFNRVPLSKITDHPNYNNGNLDNDFSILTLATPVEFSNTVAPACLPTSGANDYAGVLATVSGWGTLSSGGNQPTVLNEVDVTVQSNADCKSAYGSSSITDNMICAADAGKDSCQGDSGGPLVAPASNGRYELIGVVSWGYGCAMAQYPGVYARVTVQMNWIQSNTVGTQFSSCGSTAAGR